LADPIDALRNEISDRYRIDREIGRGGMAIVYLAHDVTRDRSVALKVLKPDLSAELGTERFLHEIQVMGGLTHPYILPLLDSGVAAGQPFYVMPYLEGESLRDRLAREGPLPVGTALRLGREIAEALDYAHRRNIVHRDLKPDNVLLSEGHAVVADFGIARAIDRVAGPKLTTTGVVLGTPAYMGPEQAAGTDAVDGRTDIYSLGCLLYEALAGQPPYTGPTAQSIMHQHLAAPVPDVSHLRPSVPTEVRAVIQRAMAKAPADRYESAGRMASALQSIEGRVSESAPAAGANLAPRPQPTAETSSETQPVVTGSGGVRAPSAPGRPTLAVALATAAVLLVALILWNWSSIRRWLPEPNGIAGDQQRPWTWVAEFDGPPDDPTLTNAVHSLLSSGLDQGGVVTTVSPQQVSAALRSANLPETTRVDAALARQLAYRTTIRTMVTGEVRKIGERFAVTVRLLDVDRDSLLLTVRGDASGEDGLIPVVATLSRKLSSDLAQRLGRFRARPDRPRSDTPSFEAYRRLTEGRELFRRNLFEDAIDHYRAALAIDSSLAPAYGGQGLAFLNLGMRDSARWAFSRAQNHRERLNETQERWIQIFIATLEGDNVTLLRSYDAMIREGGNTRGAWANRGEILRGTGRLEEALESFRRARMAAPYPPSPDVAANECETLLMLNRPDEAERVASEELHGSFLATTIAGVEMWRGNWDRVEAKVSDVIDDPNSTSWNRFSMLLLRATARSARGATGDADRDLAEAATFARGYGNLEREAAATRHRVFLELSESLGRPASSQEIPPRHRSTSDLAFALRGAAEDSVALLEASLASSRQDWDTTISLARPWARSRGPSASVWEMRPYMRILAARAFEGIGEPDSAATYYELALLPDGLRMTEYACAALGGVFVRNHLARLYAKMGRLDDARRHMTVLDAQVMKPDPDIAKMLSETRAALASAEGMAASGRR
jgi:serine/threonine protein kinase/tetratricopeptide (TPR) repeat protein